MASGSRTWNLIYLLRLYGFEICCCTRKLLHIFMLSCRGFSATSRGTEPISRDRAAAVCTLQSSCATAESASFQEIRPGSFLAEEPLTSALMLRQGRHRWTKIAQLLSASLKILVQFKFICQENKKTDFFFERLFSLLAPEASQCQEQQSPRPHGRGTIWLLGMLPNSFQTQPSVGGSSCMSHWTVMRYKRPALSYCPNYF